MKDEEDNLARLVQRHAQYVDRQTTPTARFWSAANDWPPDRPSGRLPGKAIEVFRSASGPGEFGAGEAQLQVVLQLIVMQLRAGRLEDAAADLAALDDEIKRLTNSQPNHPVTNAFQSLQGVKARLEGNFAAAAESMPRSPAPLDRSFADAMLSLPADFVRLDPQVSTIIGSVVGSPVGLHTGNFVVREVLAQEIAYQYDRAMLALSDANIPEARRRLEQAAKPQGHEPHPRRGGRSAGTSQPLPGVDPPGQRPGRTVSAEPTMPTWTIAAVQMDCRLGAVAANLAAVRADSTRRPTRAPGSSSSPSAR